MSDNAFFICIWTIVAAAFLGFVGSVTAYNLNATKTIESMVKGGASPMEARCAVETASFCSTLAARKY